MSNYSNGIKAEFKARLFLRLKGYKIIASRFRTKLGEIDIIAKKQNTLAIVEVKSRKTLLQASDAITPRQRHRLYRATQVFLYLYPAYNRMNIRFDAVLIVPKKFPKHYKNAWY